MTVLGAGGEEWRNLEGQHGDYKREHWRDVLDAAEARIEKHRKRDVTLTLRDRSGKAVAGREVTIEQTDPAFIWGFCGWGWSEDVEAGSFRRDAQLEERHYLRKLFNSVNLMLYWNEKHALTAPTTARVQGHTHYEALEEVVREAEALGFVPKGHPLYWPVPKGLPLWLEKYDLASRRAFLEVRIREITSRFRGRIRIYDAVNEMMWEPTLANTQRRVWPHIEPIEALADDIAPVLKWAHEEDPEATFLLNEYGICLGNAKPCAMPGSDGSVVTPDSQCRRYRQLLEALIARGAGPDGIGMQTQTGEWGHFGSFNRTVDYLAETTGLPVYLTEFRVHMGELEKSGRKPQEIDEIFGDYVEDMFTVAYGNPNMAGFYCWGNPRLSFDRGPSRVYQRLYALLRERWATKRTATTDAHGRVSFRGFQGDYHVRFARGGTGQITGAAFNVPAPATGALSVELTTSH